MKIQTFKVGDPVKVKHRIVHGKRDGQTGKIIDKTPYGLTTYHVEFKDGGSNWFFPSELRTPPKKRKVKHGKA